MGMGCMLLLGLGPTWLGAWLTPVWLLGFGSLLGLALLLVVWAVTWLTSRQSARALGMVLVECVPLPVLVVAVTLAVFGVVGLAVVREPGQHLNSLLRSYLSRWAAKGGRTTSVRCRRRTAGTGRSRSR